jgi:surface polysaccharide O-acyltransferase-like enzyme
VYFLTYFSIFNILNAIALFLVFYNLPEFKVFSKIGFLGNFTLYIYLFHPLILDLFDLYY